MHQLEIHTMVFMLVIVTLLLAGLLSIASLHAGNIRGIKHWAVADVCISAGFSLTFTPLLPTPWSIVIGAALLTLGQSLQYSGIQLFRYGNCNYKFPAAITTLAFLQSFCFVFIIPDIEIRAMFNSLILASINGLCAKQLLIRILQPLRTAYWLSGMSFAVLSSLMLVRFISLWWHYPGHYTLIAQIPINSVTFFIGSITQLFISFGFVLMLNYTLSSKLEQLARTDELTGALNRRAITEIAGRLCAQFARSGHSISVLMLDIDHFKNINDSYGHPVGDEVLRKFANIADSMIRQGDYVGRYGGEEFCILLPDTSAAEARLFAERLRQYYADSVITKVNNQPVYSTISIGIADSQSVTANFEHLVKAADDAMYQAKRNGRNRVCLANEVVHTEPEAI